MAALLLNPFSDRENILVIKLQNALVPFNISRIRFFFLPRITVLSVTLYSLTFRNSTCSKQVYFPPSLILAYLILSGLSMSLGSSGLGFRTLSSSTPSFSHEILFSWVVAVFPLSVKLQVNVTSSFCSMSPTSGTTTLGISLPTKRKQTSFVFINLNTVPSYTT